MKPKKLLSFILTAAMTISLMPTFTLAASAATAATEKNITLGTSALSGYDSTNGYDYIYYGTYSGDPIKWRILSMNGNDGEYTDGGGNTVASANAMLLLSEYALKQMAYESAWNSNDGDGQTNPSDWRYSDAWYWCNDTSDTSFISSSFAASEKAHLLKTSKGNTSSPYTDELEGDTFFFLSYAEATSDYIKNDRVAKMSNESGNATRWWLRSPDSNYAYYVSDDGGIKSIHVGYRSNAARPAFNLDSSKILFTSAAQDGKKTDDIGTLSANTENKTGEYKLTMLDTDRDFEVTQTTASGTKGETVTFNYDNAETDSNEYISAMIVDETDGEALYYGQLATATAVSGTVDFKIPSDINYGTYELRLFNEQINGDKKTDYSSGFQMVTLTVAGPSFSIDAVNVTNSTTTATVQLPKLGDYTLIFASYTSDVLSNIKIIPIKAETDNTTITTDPVDIVLGAGDKVILWDNFEKLTPMCDAYIVK